MIDKSKIDGLLPDELEKIIIFLKEILGNKLTDKSTISKLAHREKQNHNCPYCDSQVFVKNGLSKKGVQRYKCKDCNRSFCDTTNTVSNNSKLTFEIWINFLHNNLGFVTKFQRLNYSG